MNSGRILHLVLGLSAAGATGCGIHEITKTSLRSAGAVRSLSSAEGEVSKGGTNQSGDATAAKACTTEAQLHSIPQRMLSRSAYTNTVLDIFGADALTAAAASLQTLPLEAVDPSFVFDTAGPAMTDGHVAAFAAVAADISAFVTANNDHATVLAPCLVQATPPSDQCVTDTITQLGLHLYRRPLSADETQAITAVYKIGAARNVLAGLSLTLEAMLRSTSFLYLMETQGPAVDGQPATFALSDYEIAARLSYLLWNSTPDQALLDLAAAGKLHDPAELERQARRLLDDKHAATSLRRFYDQWLGLGVPTANAYTDAFRGGIDTASLSDAAITEVHDFLDYIVWTKAGSFADILTSRTAFVSNPALAQVYGVAAAAQGTAQDLPAEQRAGLLTRVATLASGNDTYSPILRGAKILKKITCTELASPPGNAVAAATMQLATLDPHQLLRDKADTVTSAPSCAGCHAQINPFGFALGNYDALGRYGLTEAHFDNGALINTVPVDNLGKVTLSNAPKGGIAGGTALSAALAGAPEVGLCFAKNLFEYGIGRPQESDEVCSVQKIYDLSAKPGGSIKEALVQLVKRPQFILRKN